MSDNLATKVLRSMTKEGPVGFTKRTAKYVEKQIYKHRKNHWEYRDVLFVSGCREDLPHPWRYRVKHQREQLEACNISTDEVYFQELNMNFLRYCRAIVFFRCPYTETIGKFVTVAKRLNKVVIYDVDDLVIDTVYTDQIPFVQKMTAQDKQAYDQNVLNMQKLLKRCDAAITTTECLAEELKKYVPEVFLNRNKASEEMIALSKQAYAKRKASVEGRTDKIRLGYFSGSITHNADVEMILSVLCHILEKYPNTELYLVGTIDLPSELQPFEKQIVKLPFCDWKELPELIAGVDINLAPLEDSIFNRAKSENKWVEAALVHVVTVASDVGAFHRCIKDGENGLLCRDETDWNVALEKLIEDSEYRKKLAEQAYQFCMGHCTTIASAIHFAEFIDQRVPDNYVFVLPGLEISGGMKVALKHAAMLQKAGRDVTLFTLDDKTRWFEFEGRKFPVLSIKHTNMKGRIGTAIATMWTAVEFVQEYSNISERRYLVQNYETDFYQQNDPLRMMANQTYRAKNHMKYLTISKWCQKWLKENYGQTSAYIPNGLETERFAVRDRGFDGKIRILIEGDCAVDYKNVDEAFRIVQMLDKEKFEIWYMSYNGEPKDWYRVDRFCHKIPYEKVPQIYASCDILLKTSTLESFSYPPLEMMATGGYVVVLPNGGNAEYLEDEYNCLFYPRGDVEKAKQQIERICQDEELRGKLFENGRKTAESRAWKYIEPVILEVYGIRA